ncbi:hypothetical protein AB0C12_35040 [Actinoplanes sp. NPDC048967]|uniref:hypothetical protein n=1 Tax=Actinoplanes sp. NPDC048967 TaxID=3155269 RepID=UPI0033F05F22
MSRRPAVLPAGVRHASADLTDPGSLRPALAGAEAPFVLVAGGVATIGEEVTFVELTRGETAAAMGAVMPPEAVAGTLEILGSAIPERTAGQRGRGAAARS